VWRGYAPTLKYAQYVSSDCSWMHMLGAVCNPTLPFEADLLLL
jgi:hypothetical protein